MFYKIGTAFLHLKPFDAEVLNEHILRMQIKAPISHDKPEVTNVTEKKLPSISIIIPVYNEEKRIERGLSRTLSFCQFAGWDYEIIVASEGSQDKTVELVETRFHPSERIKLLTGSKRLGKGGSIKNAIQSVSKQYIAYMDVDLSADPSEFARLLAHSDNFDIVLGSRIIRGDLAPIERPISRTIFSHLYSTSFRVLFHTSIKDPQCGFKIFRKEFADTLFNTVSTNGFAFDSEVIARAISLGASIKEIPIVWKHESYSKISIPHQIMLMGKDLLSIRYRTLMDARTKMSR